MREEDVGSIGDRDVGVLRSAADLWKQHFRCMTKACR